VESRTTWIIVTVAGLLAVVALGLIMRGQSRPEGPDEILSVERGEEGAGAPATGRQPLPVPKNAYTTTSSGLRFFDLKEGTGATPQSGQKVRVHYDSWVEGGRLVDSSTTKLRPFEFILGADQVVPGWDEGVSTMKVGGKRQLVIPPELAYGDQGRRGVPPGATVVMEVTLMAIQGVSARVSPETPTPVAETDFAVTESGLKFFDLTEGTGASPDVGQTVVVDYTGWLTSGKKFDSSLDRADPISFTLGVGDVIKGWDEGLASMRVGGKRQLVIPADLGYADKGFPPVIPPGATLVFEVQLLDVK
jgi:peptidylprolyl isomerase